MNLKVDILSLEEELTKVSDNSVADEKSHLDSNYKSLDNEIHELENNMPYPDVDEYTKAIDYDDQLDLQYKKRSNKQWFEKINDTKLYAREGSLYCGHLKIGEKDVFVMDNGHKSRYLKRLDGTEVHLVNTNDKLLQHYIKAWRSPDKYDEVVFSRNVQVNKKKLKSLDVVYDIGSESYSKITDGYLRQALLRNKNSQEMMSIIQTIQNKQDYIRTYMRDQSILVQGCAGSGKTMVLLHRLKYLLYNDEIQDGEYIFLIPGENFRNFITKISKEFNINRRNIQTYQQYYANVLAKRIDALEMINEQEIDSGYLSCVYSESFIRECYEDFFKLLFEQTEELISSCDVILNKLSEVEYEKIGKDAKENKNKLINEFNDKLKQSINYLGIGRVDNIDGVNSVLEQLAKWYNFYYSKVTAFKNIEVDDGVIQGNDEKILENEDVILIRRQIEAEQDAYDNASIFTKLAHKRKLDLLKKKYDEQVEIVKNTLKQTGSIEKKLYCNNVINGIEKVILINIKEQLTIGKELVDEYNNRMKRINCIKNSFDDYLFEINYFNIELLNEFIEYTANIYGVENELIKNLTPCKEEIEKLVMLGTTLKERFQLLSKDINGVDFGKIKVFSTTSNTKKYMSNILWNVIRRKISSNFEFTVNDNYKHSLYLQIYSKYLTNSLDNKNYNYLFIDEAQDLSPSEITLINNINKHYDSEEFKTPIINLFGDVNQNISSYGVSDWKLLNIPLVRFNLDENFRNTNQIIDYCNDNLSYKMKKVGIDMEKVQVINGENLNLNNNIEFDEVIVVKDDTAKELLLDRLSNKGIEILTVKESKGLEFKKVCVLDEGMNENEKYIAYTRALIHLKVIHNILLNKTGQVDNCDTHNFVATKYKDKIIKIESCGVIEGVLQLIPFTGKIKNISGIEKFEIEQYFMKSNNSSGKEVIVPIYLDKAKMIAFITKEIYKIHCEKIKDNKFEVMKMYCKN